MADQQIRGWCSDCRRYVRGTRPGFPHLLHFLITVLTCSLWLLGWVTLWIFYMEPFRCPICGQDVSRIWNKLAVQAIVLVAFVGLLAIVLAR